MLHRACCRVPGRDASLLGMARWQAQKLVACGYKKHNIIKRFIIVLLLEKWSSKRFIYLEASCKTDKKMPPLLVDFDFKSEKPCSLAKPSGIGTLLAAMPALTTACDCSDRLQSGIYSVKLVLNYDDPLESPQG